MLIRSIVAITALVIVLSLGACASAERAGRVAPPAGTVSHVVICYLKTPGDAAARQKLIDASREFALIPGVLGVEVGKVLPSTRPIVVSDYDVALIITTRDVAALNTYLVHSLHQKAVKEILQPLTSKIVVYDFINE